MTTPAEARLAIHDIITEILVALAVDDETTDEEVAGFEEDMGEVASVMLDAIGLKVLSVDGAKLTCELEIIDGDPLEDLD